MELSKNVSGSNMENNSCMVESESLSGTNMVNSSKFILTHTDITPENVQSIFQYLCHIFCSYQSIGETESAEKAIRMIYDLKKLSQHCDTSKLDIIFLYKIKLSYNMPLEKEFFLSFKKVNI